MLLKVEFYYIDNI